MNTPPDDALREEITEQLRKLEKVQEISNSHGSRLKVRQDVVNFTVDLIKSKEAQAVKETEKAFGGCTKCYGKGYATFNTSYTVSPDFIGDKRYTWDEHQVKCCSCDRGNQMKKLLRQYQEGE